MYSTGSKLKYHKKSNACHNSTKSMRVTSDGLRAYSYSEVICVKVTIKKEIYLIINTHKFSVTTSGHYWTLLGHMVIGVPDHRHVRVDVDTLNSIRHDFKEEDLDILKKTSPDCVGDVARLIEILEDKKSSDVFILEKQAEKIKNDKTRKDIQARNRLYKNLAEVNYKNSVTFLRSIKKLKIGNTVWIDSKVFDNAEKTKILMDSFENFENFDKIYNSYIFDKIKRLFSEKNTLNVLKGLGD